MDADIVVIGAGFAGLTVAARGSELGLKVIVLEQSGADDYPCNSRWSGGHVAIAMDDPTADADYLVDRIQRFTHGIPSREMSRAFVGNAQETLGWMKSHGVKFIRVGTDPGRQWVMAPPRRAQPGLDWKGRGPDLALRDLTRTVRSHGNEIRMGVRATSLIMEGEHCVGVEVSDGGASMELRAPAIVIADGGFQGNLELVRRFISPNPERVMQRNAGTGRGDGLRMAEAVGAKLVGMDAFYGHPLSRDAFTNDMLWPHPYLDSMAVSCIVVASDGKRFVDEGLGGVFIANTVAKRSDPLDATVIFDDAVWKGPAADPTLPPCPNPTLKLVKATIHEANSIEELARKAGLPVAETVAQVSQYNAALASDTLGSLPVARRTDRYRARPISTPPFYAIPMCAGITYTMGGPAIDDHARVLHVDGHVIEGLFAVGSASGGLEGGPEAGYLGGIYKAFTTGLRAARFIAESSGRVTDKAGQPLHAGRAS
jgi:fumarate reductase flavoprotein subunit